MAHNSDWLPSRRELQLAMARSWITVLKTKNSAWEIKNEEVSELTRLAGEAEKTLAKAVSSERTTVVTAQCKEAFEKLTAFMRNLKTRRFFTPPLTDADLISLELRPKTTIKTLILPPAGQGEAEVSYPGVQLLLLRIRPLSGAVIDSRVVHGFRIFYGLLPPGGATVEQATSPMRYLMNPPVSGEDLPHSKFTRRKKELFDFNAVDSGKTAYFCIRYENSKGQAGPWGPIFSAIIP